MECQCHIVGKAHKSMFILHKLNKFKVSKAAMCVFFLFLQSCNGKCSDILHLKDKKLNGIVRTAVRIIGQDLSSLSDIYNFRIERLGLKKNLKRGNVLSHLCQEKGY